MNPAVNPATNSIKPLFQEGCLFSVQPEDPHRSVAALRLVSHGMEAFIGSGPFMNSYAALCQKAPTRASRFLAAGIIAAQVCTAHTVQSILNLSAVVGDIGVEPIGGSIYINGDDEYIRVSGIPLAGFCSFDLTGAPLTFSAFGNEFMGLALESVLITQAASNESKQPAESLLEATPKKLITAAEHLEQEIMTHAPEMLLCVPALYSSVIMHRWASGFTRSYQLELLRSGVQGFWDHPSQAQENSSQEGTKPL